MKEIPVTQAAVGDVIAAPLVNAEGRVLLPKGARLSPAVLSRLVGWGVKTLQIEGDDPDAEPEAIADETIAALDYRFAEWEDDALMMAIKRVARRHLTGGAA